MQELLPAFAELHPTESRYARMVSIRAASMYAASKQALKAVWTVWPCPQLRSCWQSKPHQQLSLGGCYTARVARVLTKALPA